jgi:hypothetical protein
VHEDSSVASAFITVLSVEFVDRAQRSVPLDAISEQAMAHIQVLPQTEAVPIIRALVGRLTMMQALVFRCEENHLMLTEGAIGEPSKVRDALRHFAEDFGSAEISSDPPKLSAEPEHAEVLTDFFEGFEREIMKARLGEQGSHDGELRNE